jgi:peptidoglycan/xylan/chitin deacetylase (PgdA/CDA1 family)
MDRLATVCVADPILSSGIVRPQVGVSILMYHSVSNDPETGVAPYYRLATSPMRFREQMQWLREGGFEVIDLMEAQRRLQTSALLDRRSVVLTFDDGFQDFAEHAWPVLSNFGYSATMFLPTAYIGNDRGSFKGRPCLTWDEVRQLRTGGIMFGAHTVTHPVLHRMPWPAIIAEIGGSRARIEDELSEQISAFAYPFAFPREDHKFVNRLRQELVALRFSAAVTTTIGRAKHGHDPLSLRRLPVNDCDDRRLFMAKLKGGYDWLGRLQYLARSAKGLKHSAEAR